MSNEYTVYIDEAGDLGINRGTKWFVLTAVIVPKTEEKTLRLKFSELKRRLNLNTIHFRNIKDFNKRCYIVDTVSECDFTLISILFDTSKTDLSTMKDSVLSYNYLCRYLLERVSWFLRDEHARANIMLSSRGTSRDGELIQYINEKLLPYQANEIENVFDKISARSASSWDMLQLADVCATSMFYAYEPSGYGYVMPCFAYRLISHMFRYNNNIIKYGIKFFFDDMQPPLEELNAMKICRK